jgi:formate/nitrite transporter FocA (FNT family)
MKVKVTKLLSVIFAGLTICGAIYVFYTDGKANAGYAVIPMIFSLFFSQRTHIMKKQTQIK